MPSYSVIDHRAMLEQALQQLFDAKQEADAFRISSADRAVEFHKHMARMAAGQPREGF